MTTAIQREPAAQPAAAVEAFTDAVLEILAAATWPDGSALIEVDPRVLRQQLAPRLKVAGHGLAAAAVLSAHNTKGAAL